MMTKISRCLHSYFINCCSRPNNTIKFNNIRPLTCKFPHKGQWSGALMFSLICVWINGWVNNGEAGDLRRHRGHYDVNVMLLRLGGSVYGILNHAAYYGNLVTLSQHVIYTCKSLSVVKQILKWNQIIMTSRGSRPLTTSYIFSKYRILRQLTIPVSLTSM